MNLFELTRQLIDIPSVSGEEPEVGRFLASHLESLGIVLLEAWQVGTPCLVSAHNAVTSGQVARAKGGLAYERDDFAEALAAVLAKRKLHGASGRRYVERECTWPAFDARLEQLVDLVAT